MLKKFRKKNKKKQYHFERLNALLKLGVLLGYKKNAEMLGWPEPHPQPPSKKLFKCLC